MPSSLITSEELIEISQREFGFFITEDHLTALTEILEQQGRSEQQDSEVRSQLTDWYQQRTFRNNQLPFSQLAIQQTPFIVIKIVVRKLYEERESVRKDTPFLNQEVDTAVELEPLWEAALISKEFQSGDAKWIRKGSSTIVACGTCNIFGRVSCNSCQGTGEKSSRCSGCGGDGYTSTIDHRASGGSNHSIANRQHCIKCNGRGRIDERCSSCNGKGEIKCPKCEGRKKILVYEEINAKSFFEEMNKLISGYASFKSEWLKEMVPEKVFTHVEMNDPAIAIRPAQMEVGTHYEIECYRAVRIAFSYKGKREIYLASGKFFTIKPDYLYSIWKILLLTAGIIGAIILLVELFQSGS